MERITHLIQCNRKPLTIPLCLCVLANVAAKTLEIDSRSGNDVNARFHCDVWIQTNTICMVH